MFISDNNAVHSIDIVYDEQGDNLSFSELKATRRSPCRAFRAVGNSKRFLFVRVPRHLRKEHMAGLRHLLEITRKDGISYDIDRSSQQVKFSFLGCTESGIKSGHLIYFSEGDDMGVLTLLQLMGELEEVFQYSGAGKYAARLGMSFTSTVVADNVEDDRIKCIDDVFAEDKIYTTDGCSPIRERCAREMCKTLDIPSNTSVFHIRRGGMKGLLVTYPDEIFDVAWGNTIEERFRQAKMPEYDFAYRKSMLKYRGGPTAVEVHGVSEPMEAARLNFQFVVLLLYLGVDIKAFSELLKAHVRVIEAVSVDRQVAIRYLKGELDAQSHERYQDLVEMLYAGHSMEEKHLQRQLRLFQDKQYFRLREKLNINVPRSCYAYGVVDEQGILAEDEVYINLPLREGPIISEVVVARNPACKPEDIRRLKAVYKPELNFLRNCIVFPLHSNYSVPNSMSGGDLDGDKYFVCWEPTILPPWTQNPIRKPARISMPSLPHSSSDHSIEEMQIDKIQKGVLDMFLEQHYGTVLGVASNNWKQLAEYYEDEATWKYCLDLADIIQEALDFTKSGGDYPAMNRRLTLLKAKYSGKQEEERRAKLERPLDVLRALIPAYDRLNPPKFEVDPELDLKHFDERKWTEFYNEGIDVMQKFNKALSKAILEDGKDKEEWSIVPRPSEKPTSHADFVKSTFVDEYFPYSPGFLSTENTNAFLRASAWYVVGYRNNKTAFAWLGARFLNQIKAYETCGGRPGLIIGALKRIDGTGRTPASGGDVSGLPLHNRLGRMHI